MAKIKKPKEDISEVIVPDDVEEEEEQEQEQEQEEKETQEGDVEKEGESPASEESDEQEQEEKQLSEEEKKVFESLSPEERELLQDEEAQFVDGKYRVPVERISKLSSKIRDAEQRAKDTQTALEALKFQYEQGGFPQPEKRYTEEEIENIRIDNPALAEQIVSHQTYYDLRQRETEYQRQQALLQRQWTLINESETEAKTEYPELNPQGDKYDGQFHKQVVDYAKNRGWLEHDQQGRPIYLRFDAIHAAARNIKGERTQNEQKQRELAETLRKKRLKKEGVEKKGGQAREGAASKLTKEQLSHCKLHGIKPEIYAKFIDSKEAQV